MADMTIRVLVSGRVQGVGYRQACREQAQALALSGWVRNLDDGRVELLVQGDEAPVRELIAWLHRGPDLARVDEVDIAPAGGPADHPFRIRS